MNDQEAKSVMIHELEGQEIESVALKTGVGILMPHSVERRLVESAAIHLELEPIALDEAHLTPEVLADLELVVAEPATAVRLRDTLLAREDWSGGVHPGVIVALCSMVNLEEFDPEHQFDGVLNLPQPPAVVAEQMSLLLYAHRSFARRYQTAMEELQLNRRIFRSVTSGISVANASQPDLPLTYVNPAFEVMTGYSLEEVQGKNCRFLQGSERDQPAVTLIRESLRERRESTAILRNFRKDGTPFWNELSLSPIRNREGEVTHIVGIQTDVTARVEFEHALRESEKLAAVGRLASAIAHEINNPLEAVMNLVYITERMELPAEAQKMLALADAELQRVKQITTQSLRFYKQSTQAQAVGCSELLEPVLQLYKARLENAGVVVERRERSTQSVVCMESEIRQVLNNLCSNAIDAMRPDGGRLLVRTREATEWQTGRKGVCLTIADTGSGMSPAIVKEIYKAFYTTKGIRGTGLGLWISGEIVNRHAGHLRVRSRAEPGRSGTVFQLFLPYQAIAP